MNKFHLTKRRKCCCRRYYPGEVKCQNKDQKITKSVLPPVSLQTAKVVTADSLRTEDVIMTFVNFCDGHRFTGCKCC